MLGEQVGKKKTKKRNCTMVDEEVKEKWDVFTWCDAEQEGVFMKQQDQIQSPISLKDELENTGHLFFCEVLLPALSST